MSAVALVEDAIRGLGAEDVALGFGVADEEAAAAMEAAIATARDADDLVGLLVRAFGTIGLRKVQRALGLPGGDAEGVATAWLALRGITRPRPRARPQHLAAEIRKGIAQAQTNEDLYGTAKLVAPELERLVRWVAWYYLSAGDEAARIERCRAVFARCFEGREPACGATLATTLENVSLGVVLTLLVEASDAPRRPYVTHGSARVRVVTKEELATLSGVPGGRNPVVHGRDGGEAGDSLCARISALLDGWTARAVIPRGAIVRGVDQRPGSVAVLCAAEDGRSETLLGLRRRPSENDTVVIDGSPCGEHVAPTLEPWPAGPAWSDPPDVAGDGGRSRHARE